MELLKQQGELQGWDLALKSDSGGVNRVATKYKAGRGYEIESQLEWVQEYENQELPKKEQFLSLVIGRFGGIETVPLEVLVWLMTGQRQEDRVRPGASP